MKIENFKIFLFASALAVFLFLFIAPVQAEETATSTPETEPVILTESTSTLEIVIPLIEETNTTSTGASFSASSTLETIQVDATFATTTPSTNVSALPTLSVNLNIRYQNALIFSGTVSTTPKEVLTDSSGTPHPVSASSTVLSSLIDAAAATSTFFVSQLDYYDAYKSFYLNCLTLTAVSSTPVCGNWNYVVNGKYPSVGMDSYALFGGEIIYLYFGNSWQITASTSTFSVGTTTTLSTWRYNFDNLEQEWALDGNDLIDISIANPNSLGWWDATITTTTLISNPSGSVDCVFSSSGTYFAKITSADYSKWSPSLTLMVLDAPISFSSATSTSENNDSTDESGNGPANGSGNGVGEDNTPADTASVVSSSEITDKVRLILNFLKSQQDNEGKIIDGGLTDWAIISFAANGEYAEDIKKGEKTLLDFARDYDFSDASDLNVCASYPRHILALLSGGVASSDGQIQSLLAKIKSRECYLNHQFGQNGINDDVFALFSLLAVNNDIVEPIVSDLIESIIEDQTTEGAFTWAGYSSPDITGAAINALKYASQKGALIEPDVFSKAKNYLKNQQLNDGGWGFGESDVLTTSWAMMGLNALPEGQGEWATAGLKNPWSTLTSQLNDFGYYESVWAPGTIDWFAEKHAVPALLGKSWPIILEPRHPASETPLNNNIPAIGGSGNVLDVNEKSLSTIGTFLSTSTLLSASSTVTLVIESASSPLPLPLASSTPILPSVEPLSIAPQLKKNIDKTSNFYQTKIEKPAIVVPAEIQNEDVVKLQATLDQSNDPLLPLEKKVAETAATGSAVILSASTLLILSRLLLAIL
ncbi:MAG: hypothetical protein UT86_C0001G0008 [Candidatus Magasanikbacteria bacterium GW2011_GWC2_40_17]|uniref:Squalene cyclase C-terminal domain-containing protein n=1 Tax=Candidatus Magasanikbacteria bacterium GW2011_GWA2_42_32 TaxID=1619039 RepID=A0A0G1D5N4_9BACT|nr:MAG: hypothetical protein UT86_C0001G0008 [Candidatus Magasanikbacteria bacterium GW2011_GWC2_40_17]KKS57368.1 MAG: hypothetical protein UV20_C0001G0008 [Candidatus Magasanikbacteria bacterium GW2011_GWA2_42_32]